MDSLLAASGFPQGDSYQIRTLLCRNLWVPALPEGYDCTLEHRIGDHDDYLSTTLKDKAPSHLAQSLFGALQGAGAVYYSDPAHGDFFNLKNVRLSDRELHFDDYSNYRLPAKPNVTVTGAPAQNILDSLDAAGIDDSDGSLLLMCSAFDGKPTCSYQLHKKAFPALNPELSEKLWSAFKAAAVASGLTVPWGSLDKMTIFNAYNFSYDGKKLGMVFVADDAFPPKPLPRL